MQTVNIKVKCPGCSEEITVQINLWTGEYKTLSSIKDFKAGYQAIRDLVDHFAALKGYDKLPDWKKQYFGRTAAQAKKLLYCLRRLPDPLGVAKEYLSEIDGRCQKEQWQGWGFERAVSLAPDWLLKKMGAK